MIAVPDHRRSPLRHERHQKRTVYQIDRSRQRLGSRRVNCTGLLASARLLASNASDPRGVRITTVQSAVQPALAKSMQSRRDNNCFLGGRRTVSWFPLDKYHNGGQRLESCLADSVRRRCAVDVLVQTALRSCRRHVQLATRGVLLCFGSIQKRFFGFVNRVERRTPNTRKWLYRTLPPYAVMSSTARSMLSLHT